ncbi:membrane protein implicated in regulation of membrane protease activity [Isoptericola sp. CG 20/1183]|uniref:Membrane protein implicated in regulation of membrane protease activity n=1 Tax=Isoptericola halotolerans TaxID=300560 RepID=A0ABX5E9F6_9MICO|nr:MULTISPECIES: NfeD family protein [Isoptericola]MCK0115896.1 NfeD family protein [Isoptericola sp. S6320L]PRZ02782.1 membrane protein implicated in regulation of membrane protease activity [Isoptericola sp. CG 20/1183]PRZ03138.1 membrane protein implicated in regulation of membrane protease activity [Isoptericola halotolerans]
MDGWVWWIGGALVLAVVEMLSLDLVFIMLAGGAVAGGITAAAGGPFWLQVIVACVVAVLLIVTLRPWLLQNLRRRTVLVETNAAAQVGRTAVVISEVTELGGRVKLSGEVWSARLVDDGLPNSTGRVPEGVEVRVVKIDGATAVVAPAGATSQNADGTV